jgi:hypothetical protein
MNSYDPFQPIQMPPEAEEAVNNEAATAAIPYPEVEEKPASAAAPQPQPTAQPQPKEEQKAESKPVAKPKDAYQKYMETGNIMDLLLGEGSVLNQIIDNPVTSGINDFVVDLVNSTPLKNISKAKKKPKYEDDLQQSVREISSVVAPFLALRGAARGGINKLNTRIAHPLGKNKAVQFLGEVGLDTAVGAFVDATVETSKTDDNLQGFLKKTWPQTYRFIPSDWATTDSDSPDLKRMKNVNEGIGLGMFSSFIEGSVKLLRAVRGTRRVTNYVFESESAETAFAKRAKDFDDDVDMTANLTSSASNYEEALDEIGTFNLSKTPTPTKPLLGVHDTVSPGGVRTVDDMGVVGASVDQVRIERNIGTVHGRLGNIVSEAALKYGLEADRLPKREIVEQIADQIKLAGKYSADLPSGVNITFKEIDDAGIRLSEYLLDPQADVGWLKEILDEYKDEITRKEQKIRTLSSEGHNAAMHAIKGYLDEVVNMDKLKAQAYLVTSLSGQVADIAEGARYMDGTEAIERANEMIFDRLEYLMTETALSGKIKGQSLNLLNTYRFNPNNPKFIAAETKKASRTIAEIARESAEKAKITVDTLREIAEERPDFFKPLALAWEMSDGDINTMGKLNKYVQQSLPAIEKAFYDKAPEIPNVIVQGAYSNIYNSMLSALATPIKAAVGNSVLLLSKPIAHMGGALLGGNINQFKRGWYTYSSVLDSTIKGTKHMGRVFSMASKDPSSVSYIVREDLRNQNAASMEVLKSFAQAAQKEGEDGPMALYLLAETLEDIANNPVLRFGANAMTAFDGFTRGVLANSRARMEAYDKFIDGGVEMTAKELKKAEQEIYEKMFDSNGLIKNDWVDYATGEIALNLDTPRVRSFTNFLKQHTWMRPFTMFPKTLANVIDRFGDYSPVTLFMDDYAKLVDNVPPTGFTNDEIQEIMVARGLTPTRAEFEGLRAELRGRKAIGTLAVMSTLGLWMNGRIHGNGHYDNARQKTRRQLGWKPKSIQGLDGKWYSYEWLGPMGDWLALTADVMDNFNSVDPYTIESTLARLTFVLGASLTNRSMMAGLEPMFDVTQGNASAINRWAASFTSSFAPLSGFRAEMGRLMYPALREMNEDFLSAIRNRNKYLDAIDPEGALPDAYDWLDGTKVGYSENPFIRAWNTYSPMKIADQVTSPERQFLLDIEYDARPVFTKGDNGVEYTPEERSALYRIIGQTGYLKEEIRKIMNSKSAKEWRSEIFKQRSEGKSIDPKLWDNLYTEIDSAAYRAKKLAVRQLEAEMADNIKVREYQEGINIKKQRRSESPSFPLVNK